MNDTQATLAVLQSKGWTLAAIADELDVTVNAVEKWKAGTRRPANLRPTLAMLEALSKQAHVPKMRRYTPGARTKRAS